MPHPLRERGLSLQSAPADRTDRALRAGQQELRERSEVERSMFRCIRCGEALPSDANLFGVRCDNCGGKIFTKEHPNVKKTLKAR